MISHIEKPGSDWDAPETEVATECGLTIIVGADGVPISDDVDFYAPSQADLATCPDCRRANSP